MSSADMNHPTNSGAWPEDPYGDMTPILEASVEAAKQRHPSGKGDAPTPAEPEVLADVLTAADRCDNGCGAGALYLLRHTDGHELALCHHHRHKHAHRMTAWAVVGQNSSLMAELYRTDRSKGGDHA